MTASSGTSVHTPLTGTQYRESRMSYSVSRPSASEQQKPLPLFNESNHGLSGLLAYRPSSRATAVVVNKNKMSSAGRMCDFSFQRPRVATTHAPVLQVPQPACFWLKVGGGNGSGAADNAGKIAISGGITFAD
jgi:hypothetical protein